MSDFLWVEKYRPQKIEDCILPQSIKDTFKEFVNRGEIPNLMLSGTAGIGKTTVAKALCKEIGADYYVINGSDEGRFLDTVRSQAKNFASTVSLVGGSNHKVIIIDEADNTTHDVQLLLRAFVEEFHITVDLYSLVTLRIRSLSPYIPDVRVSTLPSVKVISNRSLLVSSTDLTTSWTTKGLVLIRGSSQNSFNDISQIGDEYLTKSSDTQ